MKTSRFVVIAGLACAWPARPEGACPTASDLTAKADRILIDVRTGRLSVPKKSFGDGQAELVIHDKNPFRFTYKLTIKEEEVQEGGLAAFLPVFGDFVGGFIKAPAAAAAAVPPPGGPIPTSVTPPAAAALACQSIAVLAVEGINKRLLDGLATIQPVLAGLIKTHMAALRSYKKSKAILEADYWTCEGLKSSAADLAGLAAMLADTEEARRLVQGIAGLANAQIKAIQDLSVVERACPRVQEARALAEAAAITAGEAWSERLDTIDSQTADLAKAVKAVKAAMADPNSFWEKQPLGPYEAHTKVNGEVKVTGADGKTANTITIPTLTFGAPVFSLSGGMAFSSMGQRQYVRVQGVRETATGVEVVNRVGRSESSTHRLLPMALLHVRLQSTWFATIGATAKPDKQGTQPEFLIGGTKSFAQGWVYGTVGMYIGRQNSLDGGLSEGTIVPSSLAELPNRKTTAVRPGFSLSFRLR